MRDDRKQLPDSILQETMEKLNELWIHFLALESRETVHHSVGSFFNQEFQKWIQVS